MAERSGTTAEGGGEEQLQGSNTNAPRCSEFRWICKWQVKVGCKKYYDREEMLMSFVIVYSCSAENCPAFHSHMFTLPYNSRHLFACKTRGLQVPRRAIFYSHLPLDGGS